MGDSNTSAWFDESVNTGYVNVPDNRRLSLTQAWDSFNRNTTSGWGTSSGGDAWQVQVSGSQYYSTGNPNGEYVGQIIPNGASGTFQIGLTVAQLNGDTQIRGSWTAQAAGGTLQPVTLVARRVDANNYVRASLEELTDTSMQLSISKTTAGVTTVLGTVAVTDKNGRTLYYTPGAWMYLRFQFNGSLLRARAWPMDALHTGNPTTNPACIGGCPISYEPTGTTWPLEVTDTNPQSGTVSVRSANSLGTSRPNVYFEGFWQQTLGFTVHYDAWISNLEQVGDGSSEHNNDVLGKGASHNTSDHEEEYEARFNPINTATTGNPTPTWVCLGCFKFYAFNITGNLGAGTDYPNARCDSNGLNCTVATDDNFQPLYAGQWYDIVSELDSGDYLDTSAAVTTYVNGQLWEDATHKCAGNLYDGLNCNMSGTPEWQIVPVSGTRSLKLGTFDTYQHWNGGVDEVAIFDRKLSSTDVASLYTTLRAP